MGKHLGHNYYALFADVAKSYDQVWRDGLYLTLYSMGIRGAIWHMIQEWLNNAEACTTWNGVRGPTVGLEEGLRQGCVLSPILYCIFINCFLAKRRKDTPVPEYAQAAVDLLYSQGLQDDREDGEGVFSAALVRCIRAMLYMDDTTLVAKTKGGLKSLTEKYMRFCRKFRMRLNHKKSKVMHYRTVFGAVGGLRMQGMRLGGFGLSSRVLRPLTLVSGGGNHTWASSLMRLSVGRPTTTRHWP